MKRFKQFIKKFFLIDDTPQKIAGGAALGMFMGMFPGEGVLSTLFFATIFRLNRLAAVASIMIFNMWTTLLLLTPSAIVGGFLFRVDYSGVINEYNRIHNVGTLKDIFLFSLSIFSKTAIPILTGYLVVAGSISIGFYFLLLFILKRRKIVNLKDAIK